MRLNKDFFLIPSDKGFFLVNYATKEEFEINKEHALRLVELAYGDKNSDKLDEEIKETGIFNEESDLVKVQDWPFGPISRMFYMNTMLKEADKDEDCKEEDGFWNKYIESCFAPLAIGDLRESPEAIKTLNLPKPNPLPGSLYDALKKRRTIREFEGKEVSLQQLSDILFTSFGKFHESFGDEFIDSPQNTSWRRSSPSGGGLHSVDAYVFIMHVEGLEKGLYFYDAKKHELKFLKPGDYNDALVENLNNQHFCSGASFCILMVSDLRIVASKYPISRAFIAPLIESGHLAQTALLSAASLELQTWLSFAICGEYFINELGLKGYKMPIYGVFIGKGYKESLGPKIRNILEKMKKNMQ